MMDENRASAVLDASALVAFIQEESGFRRARAAIERGALISTINWAEVLSDMSERGEPVGISIRRVQSIVEATGSLGLVPFDETQAAETAQLRVLTKSLGLSLADRACLALGRLRRLPVLTTDRAWRSLRLSIRIDVIR